MYGDVSVDLSERLLCLVFARERAIHLAQDPAAAANFFEFSVRCCFEYLLGWDYKNHRSTSEGGLFGRLRAFYGTCEYTEQGSLHDHFLLWLKGGMNPTEIHRRLSDENFQKRFFAFFDGIIHHHLPDIEVSVDSKFEPRVERPPKPPSSDGALSGEVSYEWKSVFLTEVKKCGEV